MDFAETLKRLMELKGMSRYKLAKEIPCSQASVGNWLNGVEPTPLMRKRITEILGELPKETPASPEASGVEVNPHYYELSDSERAAVDALIDHYATIHQSGG